ncbi:hypothetical protein CEXT_155811 [Caerostris extrusa]|uniref:Uncharacterized protein n=1 Tax=Caerostris extrusa TaxID=172846 RepID=A0AAV4Y479_CAEEX|nr:hypothetical protein CEXT_155811 [Caerostris extrusa]
MFGFSLIDRNHFVAYNELNSSRGCTNYDPASQYPSGNGLQLGCCPWDPWDPHETVRVQDAILNKRIKLSGKNLKKSYVDADVLFKPDSPPCLCRRDQQERKSTNVSLDSMEALIYSERYVRRG